MVIVNLKIILFIGPQCNIVGLGKKVVEIRVDRFCLLYTSDAADEL